MNHTVVAAFMLYLPIISASGAAGGLADCSAEAFAAYGQTWAGIPVFPNIILVQPGIDEGSCAYAAEAELRSIEEWYERQMSDAGWRLVDRQHEGEPTTLLFRRGDKTFKLILQSSFGATTVLMNRPEPNKTMEPTR
jgi:hypothetical protein